MANKRETGISNPRCRTTDHMRLIIRWEGLAVEQNLLFESELPVIQTILTPSYQTWKTFSLTSYWCSQCFYFSFHCFFFWSCKTNIYSLHKIVKIQEILFLWFSHSVMSNSLWPHELQHTMVPYPSPSPGAYSNSCPSSRWCHPTIASSVIPFSHLQAFPASGSFPVSQLFASGGQSIGASIPASVLPKNIQGWFPLGFADFISLLFKGLSRVFSNTTVQKRQFFGTHPSLWSDSHNCTWLLKKS